MKYLAAWHVTQMSLMKYLAAWHVTQMSLLDLQREKRVHFESSTSSYVACTYKDHVRFVVSMDPVPLV